MQNPLESYRHTQREIRRQFDEFTRTHCPTCPTPCCRRPARIMPTDIALAESTGWKRRIVPMESTGSQSPHTEDEAADLRSGSAQETGLTDGLPCEYLAEHGCTFPADLHPYGCTAYICRYMYEELDRPTLARIKRLVRELEQKHAILLRTVRNVRWSDED